ncbi:MAG: SGNH/GDSL hydrolase family protein [Saprospiraceae bacterium]|nr:SGNH/GDSL hydrolase family protein [Saprospiraceae bacterium]
MHRFANLRICVVVLLLLLLNVTHGQDWANLDKYGQDNLLVKQIMKDGPKAVFMGNSITEVWANLRPNFFRENSFVGRGISGQTTPQMLVRFRQDVIDLNPQSVVILAGTNDIAGNTGPMTLEMILDNIKSMAELADANNIKVVLCSVLPAYDYPWRPGLKPNEKIPALNGMIKDYASLNGFHYVDFFSVMADERNGLPKKYAEDEVHPTLQGYQVMEPIVRNAIESVVK